MAIQFNSAGGNGKRVHATETQEEETGSRATFFFPDQASTRPPKLDSLFAMAEIATRFLKIWTEIFIVGVKEGNNMCLWPHRPHQHHPHAA